MNKKTFSIRGMHCRSCELLTEDELSQVPGVSKVKTNFRTGAVEVLYEGAAPSDEALREAVKRAGYEVGIGKRPWFTDDISEWVKVLFAAGIVFLLYVASRAFGLFDITFQSTENLSSLSFVLLLGLVAGLSTCMAIVGGMVLAISARYSEMHPEASVRQKFLPNVSFNVGRVVGFAVLGGLLGAAGSTLSLSSLSVGTLIVLVSFIMVLIGFQLLELFPRLSTWKLMLPKGIAKALGIKAHTNKEYSHGRTIFLGAATFFLPCGFTQAVQLFVVTQGSFMIGFMSMGAFALGTAPGLLGIGGITAAAKGNFRNFFFKIAGIIVIALGIFNFQNGVALMKLGPVKQADVMTNDSDTGTGEVQVIRIVQKGNGYFPDQVTVKRGQKVRLIVDSEESYSCAASLSIPKVGIRKTLKPGENVFEFTPGASGDIPFSCSMGMYDGVIHVTE
jgi:sulfite exporter TauE/SafE/copper chaperone CopZ